MDNSKSRRSFLRNTVASLSLPLLGNSRPIPSSPRQKVVSREGFFHVSEIEDKWYLLDPKGNPFYLRGANHYGDGSHMPWNLTDTYQDTQEWRQSLRDRMREWGFNYLPPSIGPSGIDPSTLSAEQLQTDEQSLRRALITRTAEWPAEDFATLDFPFTLFLEVPKQYMAGPGMPDVFSEEFRNQVDIRCQEMCLPLIDNPNLIGYHFCHNPPWHPRAGSFNQWITDATQPGSAGLSEWVKLMKRIYGTIDRWRATYGTPLQTWDDLATLNEPLRGYVSHARMLEDKEAFMRRICDEWYRVYHDSIRKYDSNHLILGDRNTLHLQPLPEYAIRIMKPYIDVLSVNVMGTPTQIYPVLEQVTRHWDGPIHLADTGAGVYEPGIRKSAYQAKDLSEFEEVYRGLVQMGINHPQIIGFGWCGFYETPAPSSRSGLVKVENGQPLADRLEIVKKWNTWMVKHYKIPK